MSCSWLRRILALIVGAIFAMSTSFSVVQAMGTAAMTGDVTAAFGMGDDGKSPGRDQTDLGMEATNCSLPGCPGSALTLPAQGPAIIPTDGVDLLAAGLPSLVGWAHAPDPYPPRLRTLG